MMVHPSIIGCGRQRRPRAEGYRQADPQARRLDRAALRRLPNHKERGRDRQETGWRHRWWGSQEHPPLALLIPLIDEAGGALRRHDRHTEAGRTGGSPHSAGAAWTTDGARIFPVMTDASAPSPCRRRWPLIGRSAIAADVPRGVRCVPHPHTCACHARGLMTRFFFCHRIIRVLRRHHRCHDLSPKRYPANMRDSR